MGTCSANLYKSSADTKVTLTLQPIDKKATFKIDQTNVTIKTSSGTVAVNKLPIGEKVFYPIYVAPLSVLHDADINGVFHFNLIGDLKGSHVTNYNSDRLLFYPSGKEDQYIGVVCSFFYY